MNKGSNNHYTLLLQDEAETDGVGLEEEEEVEDGLNVMEEEDEEEDEDEEEEDEPMEDSDEEEIFSSSKHRTLTHHEGANLNGQNHIGGHGNEYRLLNNNDADLKTVLDTPITIWTPTPMSPARRACFIASIMLGILVVATFLWVLPCDVQPCEGELELRDRDWAVKIEGMGINQTKLVQRLDGGNNVLLSYYTAINISSWESDNSSFPDDESWQSDNTQTDCSNCGLSGSSVSEGDGHCGLLMLDGNLGRENWRISLRECPVDLQCDLLDVSGDRVPDCIVRGANSMVSMIEARYGNLIWHLHMHKDIEDSSPSQPTSHTSHSPLKLYNPGPALLLPDVNNDSFGELLFSGLLTSKKIHSWKQEYPDSETWSTESELPESLTSHSLINHLVLVCGQSGSIIGSPLVLKQCQRILSVTSDGQAVSYSCLGTVGNEEVGKIDLTALLNQILGDAAPTQASQTSQSTQPQTQQYPIHHSERDPCKVIVLNKDVCPYCKSEIHLTHSDDQLLWHKDYEHSAGVSWAALLANGECHGAILKIWEWKHVTNHVKTLKSPPSVNRRTTKATLINDVVETEPTYLEKDVENESEVDIAFNSNNTSESNQISDLPLHTLLKTYSVGSHANVEKEIINPVREDYSGLQPPTTLESPRAKRNILQSSQVTYEHPTIHHHRGKQASGSHEDPTQLSGSLTTEQKHPSLEPEKESDTHDLPGMHQPSEQMLTSSTMPVPIPTGMRTMPPSVLAPPGYQLQQIHERLIFLKNNGSVWHEEPLANLGIGITQLCKNEIACIPNIKSHARSVAVTPGVEERAWQLISSSTTYVNTPINGEQHHTSPWTLTSIVRKIIVYV